MPHSGRRHRTPSHNATALPVSTRLERARAALLPATHRNQLGMLLAAIRLGETGGQCPVAARSRTTTEICPLSGVRSVARFVALRN